MSQLPSTSPRDNRTSIVASHTAPHDFLLREPKASDGLVVNAPSGRFDAHEAPAFRMLLESAIDAGARAVTVDLGAVVFMDSTALAELVRAQRLLNGSGGSMCLARPSDAVRVILEVTGLASVFSVIRAV
jgi:anti-sigma B factor antagonist